MGEKCLSIMTWCACSRKQNKWVPHLPFCTSPRNTILYKEWSVLLASLSKTTTWLNTPSPPTYQACLSWLVVFLRKPVKGETFHWSDNLCEKHKLIDKRSDKQVICWHAWLSKIIILLPSHLTYPKKWMCIRCMYYTLYICLQHVRT